MFKYKSHTAVHFHAKVLLSLTDLPKIGGSSIKNSSIQSTNIYFTSVYKEIYFCYFNGLFIFMNVKQFSRVEICVQISYPLQMVQVWVDIYPLKNFWVKNGEGSDKYSPGSKGWGF